jgi:NAD+ synthetase
VLKGLVVGTGNKTEILLGYTTLYGDSANAFNPIGDLYKTQVRQLCGLWTSGRDHQRPRPPTWKVEPTASLTSHMKRWTVSTAGDQGTAWGLHRGQFRSEVRRW